MKEISNIGFYDPAISEVFDDSVFGENFSQTDLESLTWALNVTQKAYDKGMVAEFLTRDKTENIADDKDYIDFWGAIAIIFGYITRLTRITGIENPSLEVFKKYLRQKNAFVFEGLTVNDLELVAQNYYAQIRRRGTAQHALRRQLGNQVDGEILRMFSNSEAIKDVFYFSHQIPHLTGWHINQNSPLYKGSSHISDFKAGLNFADQFTIASSEVVSNSVLANPFLLYEFSIEYRATLGTPVLSVLTECLDVNGLNINLQGFDDLPQTYFIQNQSITNTGWQQVKFYIHSFIQPLDNTQPYIGQNLKAVEALKEVSFRLTVTTGSIEFKNIKFTVGNLDWSISFIQASNFFNIISVNRNRTISEEEIYDNIKNYLLPYDSNLAIKFLVPVEEYVPDPELELLNVLLNKVGQGIISGSKLMLYT